MAWIVENEALQPPRLMEILLVEDDHAAGAAVATGLRRFGFGVTHVADGDAALSQALTIAPDVIILDLMIPGRDGFSVLTELARRGVRSRIIIVSARETVGDRVKGLDLGADDYLVKPFSFSELLARVRSLSRRLPPLPSLTVGPLVIDRLAREATRGTRTLSLKPREFDLLCVLAQSAGEPVARATLAREVWHMTQRATPLDNLIDVHVARLRRELDPPPERPLLHTLRGVGYQLSEREP